MIVEATSTDEVAAKLNTLPLVRSHLPSALREEDGVCRPAPQARSNACPGTMPSIACGSRGEGTYPCSSSPRKNRSSQSILLSFLRGGGCRPGRGLAGLEVGPGGGGRPTEPCLSVLGFAFQNA